MEDIKKCIRDAIAYAKEMEYKNTIIIIANPDDLVEFDLDEIPTSVWISPTAGAERGKMLVLKDDSDIKRTLYNFLSKHKELIMTGKENILLKKLYGVDRRTPFEEVE